MQEGSSSHICTPVLGVKQCLYSPLQPCFHSNRWVIDFIYWQEVLILQPSGQLEYTVLWLTAHYFRLPC